jgi:uncharacterized protein YjbI with pentapeptide repeats
MGNTFPNAANPEHLAIFRKGVWEWNRWRLQNPYIVPVLAHSQLNSIDLSGINLSNAVLSEVNLNGAELNNANLYQAELFYANLQNCDLTGANMQGAKLHEANLNGANLYQANLYRADFIGTRLDGTVLTNAVCLTTAFSDVDLSKVIGLDQIKHLGPSSIDFATLVRSRGAITRGFLHGAGLPDVFIDYLPALLSAAQVIQFYSCFISYSHKDEEFAKRLHARMRVENLRVWFAPEDIEAGKKLYEQIDQAIRIYDKLLIVLSKNSLKSEWVMTEIRKARKTELKANRRKLFPIRLVDFETIKEWECFDAESGKDLAVEVREYFIPDFSDWKDNNSFEMAFDKLLRSLKTGADL